MPVVLVLGLVGWLVFRSPPAPPVVPPPPPPPPVVVQAVDSVQNHAPDRTVDFDISE